MGRAVGVALCLLIAGGALGCTKKSRGAGSAAPAQTSWVPAYTGFGRALREAPPPVAVNQPTLPVYPKLDQVSFTPFIRFDPARAGRVLALMTQAIASSKALYVMHTLPGAEHANWVQQYGPAAAVEPDPWVSTAPAVRDTASLALVPATVPPTHHAKLGEANRALSERRLAEATQRFAALAVELDLPALWITAAELALSERDVESAQRLIERALKRDPRSPDAHRVHATIRLARGDVDGGRRALATALALYPLSERSWQLAQAHFKPRERPATPPIWIDVGSTGAVLVASLPRPEHRAYARCRAALRYEPQLREDTLGLPPPYRLSMGEELMCHEVLLAALHADASASSSAAPPGAGSSDSSADDAGAAEPKEPKELPLLAEVSPEALRGVLKEDAPPPASEAAPGAPGASPAPPASSAPAGKVSQADSGALTLEELARAGQLGHHVLFEVIGRARPEWLRTAPLEHHEALVDYVERTILR